MPYENPYNTNTTKQLYEIYQNHIDHEKKIFENSGPIGSGCPCDCNCKKCMLIHNENLGGVRTAFDLGFEPLEFQSVEVPKKKGSGIVDDIKKYGKRGLRTAKALGKYITKTAEPKDFANLLSLGKYGEVFGDAKPKKGRPKKQTKKDKEDEKLGMEIKGLKDKKGAGLGKLGQIRWSNLLKGRGISAGGISAGGISAGGISAGGISAGGISAGGISGGKKRGRPKKQTKKDKEDEKLGMEIKGLKDKKRGRPKKDKPKEGSGIVSGLLSSLGLGRSRKQKKGGALTLGETPQQQIDIINSQTGGAKKNKVIDNIISSVGSGMSAGVKEYKKKGGAIPRTIGGRKLLLKEEQPVSVMSGLGKQKKVKKTGGKKSPTAWSELLKEVKEKHPELKGLKEVIDYIKKNDLYKK